MKNLIHFYSEINGTQVKDARLGKPSAQTVQQARTLGRVAVGDADIIYRDEGKSGEYIIVIQHGESMRYRDMYRLDNEIGCPVCDIPMVASSCEACDKLVESL